MVWNKYDGNMFHLILYCGCHWTQLNLIRRHVHAYTKMLRLRESVRMRPQELD